MQKVDTLRVLEKYLSDLRKVLSANLKDSDKIGKGDPNYYSDLASSIGYLEGSVRKLKRELKL